jgi:hypothetical protein
MMRKFGSIAVLAASLSVCGAASAQTRPQPAGGGVLPLPDNINKVVSIDAQNSLLVQSGTKGTEEYNMLTVRHVYSGGIAALFGGTSIPTEQFVSPGVTGGNSGTRTGGTNIRNVGSGNGFNGGTGVGNGFNGGTNNGNTNRLFGLNSGGQVSSFAAITPRVSPAGRN